MRTLAAILVEQNRPLEIVELGIPPLKKGQVLVQIAYSGLCHTQLNEWKGTKGPDPYLPHTLGHEGSGTVLEVGEGVTKVKPGDTVVLSWIKGSGIDAPSTQYMWGDRKVNSGAISTFLEKTIISENRVIPISKKLPLREAALLGCAIPTGAGVILNEMQIREEQSIVLFGMGGIGLSALIAARSVRANPIIAVDIHNEKLTKAKELGATHLVNALECNPLLRISEILNGKGADFAFESAGKKSAMEAAFECIKAPGGHCVLAGNLPAAEKIHLNPFDLIRGKKITGTWGGSSQIDREVLRFGEIFLQKENRLKPLISCETRLQDIHSLMIALDRGEVIRGIISFLP